MIVWEVEIEWEVKFVKVGEFCVKVWFDVIREVDSMWGRMSFFFGYCEIKDYGLLDIGFILKVLFINF